MSAFKVERSVDQKTAENGNGANSFVDRLIGSSDCYSGSGFFKLRWLLTKP